MARVSDDEEQPLMTGKELLLLKKELEQQLEAERKRMETAKKIMKTAGKVLSVICVVLILLAIIFCFSSCQKSSNYDSEDIYLEEEYISKGKHEAFWDMYNALNLDKTPILNSGDVWDTEYFTLIFSDVMIEDKPYLKYDFTLKDVPIGTLNNLTIEDCYERGLLFFSVCSTDDILMYGDDFYFNTAFGCLDERNAQGTVMLHEDQFILATIIIIDGCFYTAEYYPRIL